MHIHIFSQIDLTPIEKKFWFVNKFKSEHTLKILLWAVKLSKSSYYEYVNCKESTITKMRKHVKERILKIWNKSEQIYGARKIHNELKQEGMKLSERTVGTYMRQLGIKSVYRKKHRPKTTKTTNEERINHLKDVEITSARKYIVTDITYIQTIKNGWVYQLTFMDAFTRKVLLSDVSTKMDDDFVSGNAAKLIKQVSTIKMIHSDRGSQYTSKRYKELLDKHNIVASYSAKGYPYDNAIIESYHASIKRKNYTELK